MRYKGLSYLLLLLVAVTLAGCATSSTMTPSAGLTPQPAEKLADWRLPDHLQQQGDGNTYRVLSGEKWNSTSVLELAAGGTGQMEFFAEEIAEPAALAKFHLQFLSTQGTGRLKITALDEEGRAVGMVGWVVTGDLPSGSGTEKWIDARSSVNYQGDWMQATYNIADVLAKQLALRQTTDIAKYRLSVEVGQGQHVLIKEFGTGLDKARLVQITPDKPQFVANVGDKTELKTVVTNPNRQPVKHIEVKLLEPYGYGIVANDAVKVIEELAPGETRELVWNISVQRANSVNLNKPWQVGFAVNGEATDNSIAVSVSDTRPGKIFYVMTEDLEPIDSAGYPIQWGNKNGWLDPQEYLVQMVYKAEQLDRVADQHGAKWTHYIAWPAVKAAEWAAVQSNTGKWQETIAAIKQSVRNQNQQGHEYGIHMHSDYDPYLPGNVLSYNPAVDGLWANHLKHGWAHSTTVEGDFSDYASRVGLLYAYQRIVDELAAASEHGQLLTARAGSFDFGSGSADEAMSTAAFHKIGLWGSSDADGNAGGITSAEYGREIYFTAPDDINTTATDLKKLGVVEFRPTPRQFINYDSQSAAIMNSKADQGMAFFTNGGTVKPGVHAIVGFTHAMFVLGKDGWQSTEGGQFEAINDHLAYLKRTYADSGTLTFGTATELVRSYIDYYTPTPVAVYGRRLETTTMTSEYAIDLLGRDIPIDAQHVHTVSVKYPLYQRDSAYRIVILKNGTPIYSTWGLPTPYNDIQFTIDDASAKYTMKIYHNHVLFWMLGKVHSLREKVSFARNT